ncbi:hypothetical protein K2Q08_00885, partial [Patescibacteria group bacterium]|nr:hypothetical protein [Patescibacteria group bacterium]
LVRFWNKYLGRRWDYYIRKKHDVSYPSGIFKDGAEVILKHKISDWQRDRERRRKFQLRRT